MTRRAWGVVGMIGLIAWGVLLGLFVASRVAATGSLAIPNTIAAQPTGDLQASLLDTNWTTIANYINARELTIDTLTNRPVAGTSGRLYFASDDAGGTLYSDTGVAWTQIAPGIQGGTGAYASRNLNWATSTSTNTTANGTADLVVLRNPSNGFISVQTATTTVSNDVLATSPAVNARDQASVFSPSSWVHLYYIWNGSTLGSLSSLCAPNDATGTCSNARGPVLPSTYTHWAYIGPVRFATAGNFNGFVIRGSRVSVDPVAIRANAATPTTETSIDLQAYLPPNHMGATLQMCSNRVDLDFIVRNRAGGFGILGMGAGGGAAVGCASGDAPILGQTLRFLTPTSVTASIIFTGYRVPNGGE